MNILENFKTIKTFIFDVDGVLTDNTLLITEAGEFLRTMNCRDGYAIRRAVTEGYRICIITGGRSQGVIKRLEGLGITEIFSGMDDKLPAYRRYMESHDLDPETVLYMGDDEPDYAVMRLVGLPCCPADAVPNIVEVARYVSPLKGGTGCVRDVIEKVMRLQKKWEVR